jgi:hypothetical protein
MTDEIKREIERLLDEPAEPPVGGASDRLRARLAATLSEGLTEAAPAGADASPASVAAFIDGQMPDAAREKFAGALARDPSLRADMESAADLVHAVTDAPVAVPKHLMARAAAQFAPEPPRPVEAQPRWRFSFADLLPRQRFAVAMVAALAVVLAIPAGMMLSSKFGAPGEPELSGVSDADIEAARLKECRDKEKEKAAKAEKSAPAAPAGNNAANTPPKDPCDPAELKRSGARK